MTYHNDEIKGNQRIRHDKDKIPPYVVEMSQIYLLISGYRVH